MKGIWFSCLAIFLVTALMLPATAYAGKPDVRANATDVEIVKKIGVRGVPSMGHLSKGPKRQAAEGIIGKEVSGTRHAIIIGISDYPGTAHILEGGYDLSYADDDAADMAFLLESIYGFENIQLLVDEEATRNAILSAIANLKGSVGKDDEVVFFFSGHGAKRKTDLIPNSRKGKVGIVTWGEEVFPLEGFGYIMDTELREAFKKFNTKRIVFIFDSCLAGGMNKLHKKGRIICMATTKDGIAAEYGDYYVDYYPPVPGLEPFNHGLFTYFFVELGIMYGLADFPPGNADGHVTVEEAFDFARFNLEEMSKEIPEFWQIPTIKDSFTKDLLL